MKPQALKQLKLILLLSLASLAVLIFLQNRNAKLRVAKLEKVTQDKLYSQAKTFSGRPITPGPDSESATSLADDQTAQPCSAFNEKIETLSLESLLFDVKEKKLVAPPSCTQDPLTDPLFAALKTACFDSPAPDDNCQEKIFQYRARRIQLWSDTQDLKSLSTEVLIQKFYGLLSSGQMNQPGGGAALRTIADELRIRLPQSSAPDRIAVISYLLEPPQTEEQIQAADEVLRSARTKRPDDWQLFEVGLIRKSPGEYENAVRQFAAQSPNSPVALYHLGCIAWKKGSAAEAQQYFQQALQIAPQDPRFISTAGKATTEAPGSSICSAQVSFDSQDF